MLEGKINITGWEKTTDSTNYLNSKDLGTTHFCKTMEEFRRELIELKNNNGLEVKYENNIISYVFQKIPRHDYADLVEFEKKLKIIFIKSLKSANTMNEIKRNALSLEEELKRSEQTILYVQEAMPKIDEFIKQYIAENSEKN